MAVKMVFCLRRVPALSAAEFSHHFLDDAASPNSIIEEVDVSLP